MCDLQFPICVITEESRGRDLVCTRHIHKGQLVLRVLPLLVVPSDETINSRCNFCLVSCELNVIGTICSLCHSAIFCSKCINRNLAMLIHAYECPVLRLLFDKKSEVGAMLWKGRTKNDTQMLRLAVRAAVLLSLERRKEFQEADETPYDGNDDIVIDEPQDINDLFGCIEEIQTVQLNVIVDCAQQVKYLMPSMARMNTDAIVTLLCKLKFNAFNISPSSCPQGTIVSVSAALFNHSCTPNVQWQYSGWPPCLEFYATEAILEGTVLEISYLSPRDLGGIHDSVIPRRDDCSDDESLIGDIIVGSWRYRQQKLEKLFNFICSCRRCITEKQQSELCK